MNFVNVHEPAEPVEFSTLSNGDLFMWNNEVHMKIKGVAPLSAINLQNTGLFEFDPKAKVVIVYGWLIFSVVHPKNSDYSYGSSREFLSRHFRNTNHST